MNEGILNEDLALDIEKAKKITLLGDRVIILLDQAQDTVTASGIIIPKMENQETDGGRIKSVASTDNFLLQGTILNISSLAIDKFKESGPQPFHGDKVYIAPQAKSLNFQFFPDRTKLVQPFKGLICVPHNLIEAKIEANDRNNGN